MRSVAEVWLTPECLFSLLSQSWDHTIWDLESALLLKIILYDLGYFISMSGEYSLEKRFHFFVINKVTLYLFMKILLYVGFYSTGNGMGNKMDPPLPLTLVYKSI